jgi:hypothetical protein
MRSARSLVFGVAMACCLPSAVAHAQAPGQHQPRDAADEKSLGTALLISWGATAATGIGALAGDELDHPADYAFATISTAAFVLGPTAGHWYLGKAVTTGLVIRLSGIGVAAAGIGLLAWKGPQGEDGYAPMMLTLLAGGGVWATGTIWDFATLPREVRRYNARHSRGQLGLAPMRISSGTGLALAGTF